jgi:DNA mismatch repair protein MutL
MPIRQLPPLLVNQIAAGEVIERPASIVKELVENSIDAGAGRIAVELEQGGIELVRVVDDGCGIPPGELTLAVTSHATSKIVDAADLDRISTMGFRGEALASIASVSRLSIRSRPASEAGAAIIEAAGDQLIAPRPIAGPIGTAITARNLFFNTPARRKFLRTESTEYNHCLAAVRTLAMSHPAIGFTMAHNGRLVLELPPDQSPRRRVVELLGRELEDQLIEVSCDAARPGAVALWGLAGLPALARNTTRMQHVFLNGRSIRDRSIQHAMKEAYRGLIEPGRHPTIVLFLEMDPGLVDVNVHPAKAEVRFRDQSAVHGAVLRTIRDGLATSDLTPDLVTGSTMEAASSSPTSWPFDATPPAANQPASAPSPTAFVEHFRRLDPKQRGFVYREVAAAMDEAPPPMAGDVDRPHEVYIPNSRRAQDVLQVHNSFLVTQDEDGLLIIDQHALHERVMFEQLKARIGTDPLQSQRLLMPQVVDVTESEIEALDELAPLLERIGIEAEPIGPTSIAVHAFALFLLERKVEIEPFVRELLDVAQRDGFAPDDEAALHEVLDMMACKAAVKAGDALTDEELSELLRQRGESERTSNCPHGRPTTIRITLRDLYRQFGRS